MYRSMFAVLLCCSMMLSTLVESSGECGKCSNEADEQKQLQSLREKIQALEPLHMNGIGNCKTCIFTGAYDFTKVTDEKSCAVKTETGIVRQATFEWRNVSGQCDCHLSETPSEALAMVSSLLSNPNILECAAKIAETFITSPILPSTIESSDVKDLQICLPTFARLIQQKHSMKSFKVGANWQKARLYAELHSDLNGKNSHVTNVKVLHDDAKGLVHMCEGPDVFTEACRCLVETNYMGHFFMSSMKAILPCWLERESGDYREIIDSVNECKME